MKRRVVLLGPPGSGKGTVAQRLQQQHGLKHVSSGHLLRREIELGTEIGQQVKMFLDKGELAPDKLVLDFMSKRSELETGSPGFLLDGFPRTINQAVALDQWLGGHEVVIEAVLFYNCDASILIDRITGRRECPKCGRGYHIRNKKPVKSGLCDICHMQLVQREDDTEPVLRRRLDVYARETEPLVEYYTQQEKLTVIDAALPSDAIYSASVEALSE